MNEEYYDKNGIIHTGAREPPVWGEPEPLDKPRSEIPFNTKWLPDDVADYVEAFAEIMQIPAGLPGTIALGVLAGAAMRNHAIKITESWVEPLCLFVIGSAESGGSKSPTVKAMAKPLYAYEKWWNDNHKAEVAEYEQRKQLLEQDLKTLKSQRIGKNKDEREALLRNISDLNEELEGLEVKKDLRLTAQDSTPEALELIMQNNDECMTLISTEGSKVFESMLGRYEKGGNISLYLQASTGDELKTDRMGRQSISMSSPKLTMILAVQPDVIQELFENKKVKSRGLMGRFIYTEVNVPPGEKEPPRKAVPPDLQVNYSKAVYRILNSPGGVLVYDKEAQERYWEHWTALERLKRIGSDYSNMDEWLTKAQSNTARIAAILHTAGGNGVQYPITLDTLECAIALMRYYLLQAANIYSDNIKSDDTSSCKYLLAVLKRKNMREFTRTDIYQPTKKKRGFDLDETLNMLQEKEYLRVRYETSPGAKRPTRIYTLNPKIVWQPE
ncbi:MAG: DUF3987 domain-containing protein [Oscillospiraceae bacterium]|jgi:hypothetical protein|nr:DUF3987 domain-containing protein [Oscillospiraceae bacterium]